MEQSNSGFSSDIGSFDVTANLVKKPFQIAMLFGEQEVATKGEPVRERLGWHSKAVVEPKGCAVAF